MRIGGSSFCHNPFSHESVNAGWVSSFCPIPSSHEIAAVPLHRGNLVHPKNWLPRFGLFFASRTPVIPLNQGDFSKYSTNKIGAQTKSIETKGLKISKDPIKTSICVVVWQLIAAKNKPTKINYISLIIRWLKIHMFAFYGKMTFFFI